MFVRKKNNPSGVVSIQVIDKSKGKYRVVKTIGSSKEPDEASKLYSEGKKWIASCTGQQDIFVLHEQKREEKQVTLIFFTIFAHVVRCCFAIQRYNMGTKPQLEVVSIF